VGNSLPRLIPHFCGGIVISAEQYKLYRLNLLPLRCDICGLLPPVKAIKGQGENESR
jgi:hypothetical protein